MNNSKIIFSEIRVTKKGDEFEGRTNFWPENKQELYMPIALHDKTEEGARSKVIRTLANIAKKQSCSIEMRSTFI